MYSNLKAHTDTWLPVPPDSHKLFYGLAAVLLGVFCLRVLTGCENPEAAPSTGGGSATTNTFASSFEAYGAASASALTEGYIEVSAPASTMANPAGVLLDLNAWFKRSYIPWPALTLEFSLPVGADIKDFYISLTGRVTGFISLNQSKDDLRHKHGIILDEAKKLVTIPLYECETDTVLYPQTIATADLVAPENGRGLAMLTAKDAGADGNSIRTELSIDKSNPAAMTMTLKIIKGTDTQTYTETYTTGDERTAALNIADAINIDINSPVTAFLLSSTPADFTGAFPADYNDKITRRLSGGRDKEYKWEGRNVSLVSLVYPHSNGAPLTYTVHLSGGVY